MDIISGDATAAGAEPPENVIKGHNCTGILTEIMMIYIEQSHVLFIPYPGKLNLMYRYR